jgi:hypothetical protein
VGNVASMEQIRSACCLRFHVFNMVNMSVVVFWIMMLCGLVGGYQCYLIIILTQSIHNNVFLSYLCLPWAIHVSGL